MRGILHRGSSEVSLTHVKYREVVRSPLKVCLLHWKARACGACNASVGIDLGTSNSAVAAVVDGVPTPIPLQNGEFTMPSKVAFSEVGAHDANNVPCGSAERQSKQKPRFVG